MKKLYLLCLLSASSGIAIAQSNLSINFNEVIKNQIAEYYPEISEARDDQGLPLDVNGINNKPFDYSTYYDVDSSSYKKADLMYMKGMSVPPSTQAIEDPDQKVISTTPEFVGANDLTNNTDYEQKLTTSSYTKTVTNTVTTTTTALKVLDLSDIPAVNAAGNILIKMIVDKMPFTINGYYKNNITTATATSEQKAYTATPQTISVPAHSVAHVRVSLDMVDVKGTFTSYNNVTGAFGRLTFMSDKKSLVKYGNVYLPYFYQTFCQLHSTDCSSNEITYDDNSNSLVLPRPGTYSARLGTNFVVNVTIEPLSNSIAKGRALKAINYTFKVSPASITTPVPPIYDTGVLPFK